MTKAQELAKLWDENKIEAVFAAVDEKSTECIAVDVNQLWDDEATEWTFTDGSVLRIEGPIATAS